MPGHFPGLSPQIHRGPDPGCAALDLGDSPLFAEDRRPGGSTFQPVPQGRLRADQAIKAEKPRFSHCLDWAGNFRILAAGWGPAERQLSVNVSPFSRPKMTMRIATTLMLGAALLAGAGASAQEPRPAVPPRTGSQAITRTAAAQPVSTVAPVRAASTSTPAAPAVPAKP